MTIPFDPTITAGVVLSIILMIYTHFKTRNVGVDDRFKAGDKRITALEKRASVIEQKISSLPEKDDMHRLELEMVKMTGSLSQIQAVMEGNAKIMERLETIVSRHEDHLLDGGKTR